MVASMYQGMRGRPRTLVGPRQRNNRFYRKPPASARLFNPLGLRTRLRTRTRTATTVQRRRLKPVDHKTFQNAGGIVTQSYFTKYNKPSYNAIVKKNAASPSYYITNQPSSFNASCGFQGSSIFQVGTRVDLDTIFTSLGLPPSPNTNKTGRMLLEQTLANIVFTNSSSVSCTLDLYDIVCKQDNDITNPLQSFSSGVAMETTASQPDQVLGVKPWQSQQFNEFNIITRTTHVNLAPGAAHRHNIRIANNTVVKRQRVEENEHYRGISHYVLAIVKGIPVSDEVGSPSEREVSTAPIRIDWVSEVSYKVRFVMDQDVDLAITNNMVTLLAPDSMNTFRSASQPVSIVNP